MAWTLAMNSAMVKPPDAADRARTADSACRMRGWLRSSPPTRVAPDVGGGREPVEEIVGDGRVID
jgi:hypothetical protein